MRIHDLLQVAVDREASDLILTVGSPPVIRRHGSLVRLDDSRLTPAETEGLLFQVLSEAQRLDFQAKGQISASYGVFGTGRFRLNGFRQRGTIALAIRIIPNSIRPSLQMTLPEAVLRLALGAGGLVIVCGSPSSGRSTTLASLVEAINSNRTAHIVTLEDPIEYLHKHGKSVINQREIGIDTVGFETGIAAALRQTADVIVLGDLVPAVTGIVLDTAAVGILVLAAMTARSAVEALSQVTRRFPPDQQPQAQHQLADSLRGVVCQQLIPKAPEDGQVAAFEVLTATAAAREHVRQGRWADLQELLEDSSEPGLTSMRRALSALVSGGVISEVEAGMRSTAAQVPSQTS
jgi:twitching motility protein PilT